MPRYIKRGSSSVGRTSPCQGEGRRFESGLPLKIIPNPIRLVCLFFWFLGINGTSLLTIRNPSVIMIVSLTERG